MRISRMLSNGFNLGAAALALYAALFYWTRGWIEFIPQSLPWLLYTLLPYVIFWLLRKNLQMNDVSKARNILFVIVAIGLFLAAFSYLKFTDEYMVFYLKQLLLIVPLLSVLAMSLVMVVGILLTESRNAD